MAVIIVTSLTCDPPITTGLPQAIAATLPQGSDADRSHGLNIAGRQPRERMFSATMSPTFANSHPSHDSADARHSLNTLWSRQSVCIPHLWRGMSPEFHLYYDINLPVDNPVDF
jgi:hypothetical protein